ncbi:hypothetical protein LINPERPRIM_LOCUS23713 [Linum perenne]
MIPNKKTPSPSFHSHSRPLPPRRLHQQPFPAVDQIMEAAYLQLNSFQQTDNELLQFNYVPTTPSAEILFDRHHARYLFRDGDEGSTWGQSILADSCKTNLQSKHTVTQPKSSPSNDRGKLCGPVT